MDSLGFVHVYRPAASPSATTLLLLHGTGGTEQDLLTFGAAVAPAANLLSPRGKVSEDGQARFFRRLAPGVFDLDDLQFRTHELAGFLSAAARHYGFDSRKVVATGYSNGANVASALLLLRPEMLAGGVLLRGMVPLVPNPSPDLINKPVLICEGTHDPLVTAEQAAALIDLLKRAGADVTVHWHAGGHELAWDDVTMTRQWLADQSNFVAAG